MHGHEVPCIGKPYCQLRTGPGFNSCLKIRYLLQACGSLREEVGMVAKIKVLPLRDFGLWGCIANGRLPTMPC